jgi:hypothetical protein
LPSALPSPNRYTYFEAFAALGVAALVVFLAISLLVPCDVVLPLKKAGIPFCVYRGKLRAESNKTAPPVNAVLNPIRNPAARAGPGGLPG